MNITRFAFILVGMLSMLSAAPSMRAETTEDPKATRATIVTEDARGLEKFLGIWDFNGSMMSIEVGRNQGRYYIEAYDRKDNERCWVSKWHWVQPELTGKFVMPSTVHVTFVTFSLSGPDTLKANVTGDATLTLVVRRRK